MDPSTQQDQTAAHLEQLILAELDAANRHLTEAGRTIDTLQSDALALAARVDGAREEAESYRAQLEQERGEAAAEKDSRTAVISDLEAHVARLKTQLERPERLMVKKALRRGPYARPDAS